MRLYPMDGLIDAPGFDNHEGGVEDLPYRRSGVFDPNGDWTDASAAKGKSVLAYINGLAALKTVVLLYPTPEVGWTPARLNLNAVALGAAPPRYISTSRIRMKERNAQAERLLDAVTSPNVLRVKPEALFCDTVLKDRCIVQADDVTYYADDNHLSMQGARLVVQAMLPYLDAR